jgi:carbon storage regulator
MNPRRVLSMLVLSRRPGEEIVINDDIRLTVVSIKGDRIRLGISAPPHVQVDRAEVHERKTSLIDGLNSTPVKPKSNYDTSELQASGTVIIHADDVVIVES